MEQLNSKKILVIVDSFPKMQTLTSIFNFLQLDNIKVISTGGQLVNIGNSKESYYNTGIYPEDNFRVDWEVIPNRRGTFMSIQEDINQSDLVYIFTEPGLAGIQFAWTIVIFFNILNKYRWAELQSITPESVTTYLQTASVLDQSKVDAAQTKLIINKMIGYTLGPILKTYLEIGHISHDQILLLNLLAQREREITNFDKAESYYTLELSFSYNNKKCLAAYSEPIKVEATAERIKNNCKNNFIVTNITQNKETGPLTLSKLLRLLENKLQVSAQTALTCLQQLYEGIKIDNTFISFISYYNSDSAILCTQLQYVPNEIKIKFTNKLIWKIYNLIWQYNQNNSIVIETSYTICNNNINFNFITKDPEIVLNLNEVITEPKLIVVQKRTQPLERYTEAQILNLLDNYKLLQAVLSSNLFSNKKQPYYIVAENQIILNRTGLYLEKYLEQHLSVLASFEYNKKLEEQIQNIYINKTNKQEILQNFYTILKLSLESIKEQPAAYIKVPTCPLCNALMVRRKNKWGNFFYGCSTWPNCKGTRPIDIK